VTLRSLTSACQRFLRFSVRPRWMEDEVHVGWEMEQFSNSEEAIVSRGADLVGAEGTVPTDVSGMRWSMFTTDGEVADGGETILLVEDEAFVRQVTSEVLLAAGYKVLVAKTADEAAQTKDQHRGDVHLLLTDVILPGRSGRALANELKRCCPSIAILLVSGYAQQWTKSEAGVPAEECMPKPFSATALLSRVRQVLNRQKKSRMHEPGSIMRASDNA